MVDKDMYKSSTEVANENIKRMVEASLKPNPVYGLNEATGENYNAVDFMINEGDSAGLQDLANRVKPYAYQIINASTAKVGTEKVIPKIPTYTDHSYWNNIIEQIRTSPNVTVRTRGAFRRDFEGKEEKLIGLISVPDDTGEKQQIKFEEKLSNIKYNVYNSTTGKFEKKTATLGDIYDTIGVIGYNKSVVANSQQDFRNQVIDLMDVSSKDVSPMQYLGHVMTVNKLFPNGYINLQEGQVSAAKQYIESLPDNLKQNPKFMLELLANGFRRTASVEEMTESHATFDGFVEKILSIDKTKKSEFLKAKANVQKPLDRARDMIRMIKEASTPGQSFPLGIAGSTSLFFKAVGSLPEQIMGAANNLFKLEDSENFFLQKIQGFKSERNPNQQYVAGFEKDQKALLDNMAKKEQALRNKPNNEKAITAAKLAVMQYNTYLLAFEMAAAVQGGGDSRTISDRDVRIMQKALMVRFVTSPEAFQGVLEEIVKDLEKSRKRAKFAQNMLGSTDRGQAKAYHLLEQMDYMDDIVFEGNPDLTFGAIANAKLNEAMVDANAANTANILGNGIDEIDLAVQGTAIEGEASIEEEVTEDTLKDAKNWLEGDVATNVNYNVANKRVTSNKQLIADIQNDIKNIIGSEPNQKLHTVKIADYLDRKNNKTGRLTALEVVLNLADDWKPQQYDTFFTTFFKDHALAFRAAYELLQGGQN